MALWWLLPAGVARVELVGVPFPCGAGRTFGGFGGFEAWQTAALNAYKKPLLRPWGALEPLLWPCGGFCLQRWAWQGFKKDRIHTSGGPRRRPGLGEGRGRRIFEVCLKAQNDICRVSSCDFHMCQLTVFFVAASGVRVQGLLIETAKTFNTWVCPGIRGAQI